MERLFYIEEQWFQAEEHWFYVIVGKFSQDLIFLFFIGLIVVGIAEGIKVIVKKEWREKGFLA